MTDWDKASITVCPTCGYIISVSEPHTCGEKPIGKLPSLKPIKIQLKSIFEKLKEIEKTHVCPWCKGTGRI